VVECSAAGQANIRVRVPPGEFTLGREPGCHIFMQGKQVSRKHAKLTVRTDGSVLLEDLGSFNGTVVDGARVQRAVLRGRERVSVGEWSVKVRPYAPSDNAVPLLSSTPVELPPPQADWSDGTAVNSGDVRVQRMTDVRPSRAAHASNPAMEGPAAARGRSAIMPVANVQWQSISSAPDESMRLRNVEDSPLLRKLTMHTTPLQVAGEMADVREFATLARSGTSANELALRLVYRVAAELQTAKGEDDFLGAMADTLQQATRAQTVALLMFQGGNEEMNTLVPRVVRTQDGSQMRFSRSVVEQALRKRAAVATEDARSDARFANNASILDLDLKAALAVPMLRDQSPVGVIYMTRRVPFSDGEEDLAAALGHLTALGIERARLKEKVAEEEALRMTLERFHTPEVVEKLMQKKEAHAATGGLFLETITATVLFCDLCGFTSYCEMHSADEVASLLNSYLGEMTRVVYQFNGTVDKYIGDAVMAVFGAPFPADDDAQRAAHCALAMQEAFEALMARRPEGERLKLRVGVNTGLVVAGTVGSPLRMEYTCLGDTVNVAQRLESIAPHGGILVGRATAEVIGQQFVVQSKGSVTLKGKAGAVEIFKLVEERTNPTNPTNPSSV
jgi:adenylate cyclase